MKKLLPILILCVIASALILFVPVPTGSYDDGGTREYTALTYKIVCWNRLAGDGVYRKTSVYRGADRHLSLDELFAREVPYMPVVDDPPIENTLDFDAQYIRTDGYHEDAVYPAVTVIRSSIELNRYYHRHKDLYNLERRDNPASDSTIGFLDACDRYDDAFFDEKCLILIVLEEPSGSIRHTVTVAFPIKSDVDSVPPHTEALYSNKFAEVVLPLPEGWDYETLDDGIRFYPKGQDGHLRLSYTDAFGVCGTCLQYDTVILGGYEAERGTYDNHTLWDYIVLPKEWYSVGDYVMLNEGADIWWDDYGDEAMSILDGIRIYEKVTMEDKAIVIAKDVCDIEYDSINAVFDTARAVWEITFFTKDQLGGDQTVTVDGFTDEILEIEYGE